MTPQTMTHREYTDGAARKRPVLRNRRARRACAEPRGRQTADSGDRR